MANDRDLISKRNSLIAYILNNAYNKLPMKATDITGFLENKAKMASVLTLAATALKTDYGIIFEEIPDQKSGKKFICYAENTIKSILELDEEQKRQTTLLFLILSYIFMSGGSVYEAQLENFLESLGIYYSEEHSYFGPNVKKLVTETFIKQMYLKKKKSESEIDTDLKYILEWGYRADKEFQKMKVLEVAAKLMGRNAKFFQSQYIIANEDVKDEDDDVDMV